MIKLNKITIRRGPKVLMEGVDWTIYHKQRIGIIGANGTGKTSLFALLLGQLQADVGELEIARHIRLAHVAQETPALSLSALDYVLGGDEEYVLLQQALKVAEESHDAVNIALLHEKIAVIDGYTAPSRAAQLLAGLGFSQDAQQKSVSSFSGGWRVRLNLARALMCRSDVLLLDEPTNHLDLDAVLWLEQWLKKYTGTLLIISHDREFLDETVDHIAHLANQRIKVYSGNYSTFEKTRALELQLQQAAYEKQQKQVAHMKDFVERFRYKATKAKQAQSRLKAIERMDMLCAVQVDSPFQFRFRESGIAPNPLIRLEKAVVQYDQRVILNNLNLSIAPRDRIGVLGPNGAGKSSLIKLLAGEIQASQGERQASAGLRIGYFAQHQVDHLKLNESPLDHMRRLAPTTPELDLRKYLGTYDFTGDRVNESIKNFSGGEKSRLALALIIWNKPNLLLLDEPTNHLDLDMRNALSIALQEYDGAMLLVSHDRFLVRSTTDKLMLVADQKMQEFDGDLEQYQGWLIEYRKQDINGDANKDAKTEPTRKEMRQQAALQREQLRPLTQKIAKLEKELEKLNKQLAETDLALSDLGLYEPDKKEHLQKLLMTQAKIKKDIEFAENEWLIACEERDQYHD